MAKRDFYEIFGVAKTATDADLKSAFRKAAMAAAIPTAIPATSRPKPASRKSTRLINTFLIRRSAQPTTVSATPPSSRAAGGMNDGFGASMSDIFDDLFGDIMGRRGGAQPLRQGARRRPALQSRDHPRGGLRGKNATIKMPTSVTCETCQGSGAKPGSKPVTCRTCAGQGRVRAQQGFFAIERTCPTCHGRGQIIENPCDRCAAPAA